MMAPLEVPQGQISAKASKPGGTVGVLATVVGVGMLAGPGSVIALKIVDSCCRAACWLSLMGESGEAGDGCMRALVKSRAAARATSIEEDFGMETFVGNQTTVSAMRSDVVSSSQRRPLDSLSTTIY